MKYTVDYRDIVVNLIPNRLRKTKFASLLYSLIKGLSDLNATLGNANYFLKFNTQIIYIEKYLNDLYDPINTQIYIVNNASSFVVMFNRIEESLQSTVLYNRSESAAKTYFKNRVDVKFGYDYTVFIPNSLSTITDKITASVNLLNPADKIFDIQTI
jgi:hypothetical protein